jgi:UDP-glucose 4-epimerase
MARCLVTGHRGYIGSHLYAQLQELGHDVRGIDAKPDAPGNKGHNILQVLKEYEDGSGRFHPYFYDFKPEYVFHMACVPRVAHSVAHPVQTMENNVLCTSYVLNFARKVGAKRVIYSGSSSVVGDGNGPNSPYGLQKLISEMECKLYSGLYGLDTVSLRYFNVYSADQEAEGAYPTAIANFMACIRSNHRPFITGTGEQRRDMAHVKDVVAANIFAMNSETNFNGAQFDVGTGSNISLNEIKNIVLDYFPKVNFQYIEERTGDVLYTQANILPLSDAGWTPSVGIQQGINECFRDLKDELE